MLSLELELVDSLQRQGFTLRPLPGDKLEVRPASRITPELREALRTNKKAILATLTRPHINSRGELIVPFDSDKRFHWWNPAGQSIRATLLELNAPPDVVARYVEADTMRVRQ